MNIVRSTVIGLIAALIVSVIFIVQLECQLVTHGLYCGDEAAWNSPRRAELEPGAAEWRLLLQVDSDDDLGVMWGDCGLVYYWLREPDLRARRFGESWTILQCS